MQYFLTIISVGYNTFKQMEGGPQIPSSFNDLGKAR